MLQLILTLLLFSSAAMAYDKNMVWGGVLEDFITAKTYSFGSDSMSRVRKELKIKGYEGISLNVNLEISPEKISHISIPRFNSSVKEISLALQDIKRADGKVRIRPILIDTLDNEKLRINNYNPLKFNSFIVTYERQFIRLLNDELVHNIDQIVYGDGVSNYLISNNELSRAYQSILNIKSKLSSRSDLILSIEGVLGLDNLLKKIEVDKGLYDFLSVFDGLSIKLDSEEISNEYLATLLKNYKKQFKDKIISIDQIVISRCDDVIDDRLIQKCVRVLENSVEQKFNKLVKSFNYLSAEVEIDQVEIITATTNYEPRNDDYIYSYYEKNFNFVPQSLLPNEEEYKILPALPIDIETKELACIYYDDFIEKPDMVGRVQSLTLQSLLGSFPMYEVVRFSTDDYNQGDIFNCEVAFYMGTNFFKEIPEVFLKDVVIFVTTKNLVWMNYKLGDFATELNKVSNTKLAFNVPFVLSPDSVPSENNIDPGFYKYFEYKGEEFFKLNRWNKVTNKFTCSPEINLIIINDEKNVAIHSMARHTKTEKKIPYVISQNIDEGKIWYFADMPVSFLHYEDRYLIMADLLWDILNIDPPTGSPKALVRIEDVNPTQEKGDLLWAINYLRNKDIPVSLALIPYFSDIFGRSKFGKQFKPISKFTEFIGTLKYAKSRDVDFVWHGVAHQVGDYISGYTGLSGADYEFWLYPENQPIPEDSVDWVLNRLEMGHEVFKELEIEPGAWEIPHYAASVLDYKIFSKVFEWTYHRSVLFDHSITKTTALPEKYWMKNCISEDCKTTRRQLLRNIEVKADYSGFGASLYPYINWGDIYGQKVIPETLGMIDFAFYNTGTWRFVNTPYDLVRRARKLKVIRGAMASFFWHPDLFIKSAIYFKENPGSYQKMGGENSLRIVIEGLEDLGYEFVSINDCKVFPRKECA